MRRFSKLALCAVLALGLGACQDSLDRRETIALAAGNAIEHNKAVHIIDPWPASSANVAIPANARRAADAIERYETRANGDVPRGGPPVITPLPVAPTPIVTP